MGDGFNISIGMSTQSIMGNLCKIKGATDKTKQMIINFCTSDLDGKVTNDIELSMLNAWANGQEQVPMPQKPSGKGWVKNTGDETTRYYKGNQVFEYGIDIYKGKSIRTDIMEAGNIYSDTLIDEDQDGYADKRFTSSKLTGKTVKEAFLNYYDQNLDGKTDDSEVVIFRNKPNGESVIDTIGGKFGDKYEEEK